MTEELFIVLSRRILPREFNYVWWTKFYDYIVSVYKENLLLRNEIVMTVLLHINCQSQQSSWYFNIFKHSTCLDGRGPSSDISNEMLRENYLCVNMKHA